MDKWTGEMVKKYLTSLMRNESKLHIEQFTHFYEAVVMATAAAEQKRVTRHEAMDIFKEFDTRLKGFISREELASAPEFRFSWTADKLEEGKERSKRSQVRDEL